MKLKDVKWALAELAASALHGPRCDCPRHNRLAYSPARSRRSDPERDGKAVVDPAGTCGESGNDTSSRDGLKRGSARG